MQAELILRVVADPNAVTKLEGNELCELLAEAEPPTWVFEEAARRRLDERVIAHLFSHPKAEARVLESAFTCNACLFDRLRWHARVVPERVPELSEVFANLIPEEVAVTFENPRAIALLEAHLSPLCLYFLERARRETTNSARAYAPLSRFLLLGDFLYYLECGPVANPNDLPVVAKVALALNPQQPLEPYLNDADLRVRRAAKERSRWNES